MMSRESLEELKEFVELYKRILENVDIDIRFDMLMDRISPRSFSGVDSGSEGIALIYEPYGSPHGDRPAYAAATEHPVSEPARFCSEDGRYTLRELSDPESGISSFYLIGERDVRTAHIEVVVDGVALTTDENGFLETGTAGVRISKSSRIYVKSGSSN